MKALRQAIAAQIKAQCLTVKYINTWNNQAELLRAENENESVQFKMPAVFVEVLDSEIHTLGNGNQTYDPLDIRIHLLHRQDKSINMDENLDFEDVRQTVFAAMHKFQPSGTSGFFRIQEQRDYDHDNTYHLMMDFRTAYIDSTLNEPRNSVPLNPPFDIEVDASIVPEL